MCVRRRSFAVVSRGRVAESFVEGKVVISEDAPPADNEVARSAEYDVFRQFADTLPIMVWQQDASGEVIFLNTGWFEFTRLPRDPSSYRSEGWKRVVHPDDFAAMMATLAWGVAHQAPYELEARVRPVDGGDDSYQWLLASAKPRLRDGKFDGWIGSVVNIQDTRKREEDATRRLEEFRALGEAVPQIVWTADATGSLDWYNHRWYEYTGQTPQEALGWGWQAVQHPEDFPAMFSRWTQALATGEPVEMEFRLRGRDGAFRWFLTLINPFKDEHGNIVRWFGTNTDIHDRKIHAERSKRVAQTLQEVFLPDKLPRHPLLAFDAVYVPAESDALVGGDWYDAFELPAGRVAISIGDVAGHGLDAAVIAGRLRQTIFSEALTSGDPAAILVKADLVLRAQTETIATALVAFIELQSGEMVFASAGHPSPIVADRDMPAVYLQDGSAPLGSGFIAGGLPAENHVRRLSPDSLLAFYTDGITEYGRDIISGREALLRNVDEYRRRESGLSARELYSRAIGDNVTTDDVAMLLASWKPAAVRAPLATSGQVKHWRFHSSHAYSANAARHELMSFIRAHAPSESDLFTIEIILGELLANTVEHAPGLVEISIDWSDNVPVLTIRDAGRGFDVRGAQLPTSEYYESGRGLYLVRSLSAGITIKPAAGFGSELVVTLPIERAKVM